MAGFWLWRSYSYGTDTITVEPELMLIGSDYVEGLISKMRNIHKSTPPSFRRRENAAAIVKAPPPGALTKGPDRKFPGLHPPPGGATSPFLLHKQTLRLSYSCASRGSSRGPAVPAARRTPPGQDGAIMYPENGTGPVATYTAVDPEGTAIASWSLGGADAGTSPSEGGVLAFKKSPDFENATGGR